mmetsp:Transcript_183/g.112  ORF Transcript_183/g.112 Transcript_183/m.112 type:complete len:106 (+) Transcript_183:104-421(+)
MAQGKANLNKFKPGKTNRHVQKKVSKVDTLAKKKKSEKSQTSLGGIASGVDRKMLQKTEANLAGRAQVENSAPLKMVSVTPQVLAKAKDVLSGRNKMRGRKKGHK